MKKWNKLITLLHIVSVLTLFFLIFTMLQSCQGNGGNITNYSNELFDVTLSFPKSWENKYILTTQTDSLAENFVKVYEKKNHEKYNAEGEENPFGWLFSIYRMSKPEWESLAWREIRKDGEYHMIGQTEENGDIVVYILQRPDQPKYDMKRSLANAYRKLNNDIPVVIDTFYIQNEIKPHLYNGDFSDAKIHKFGVYTAQTELDLREIFFANLGRDAVVLDATINFDEEMKEYQGNDICLEILFNNPQFEFVLPDADDGKSIVKNDFDKVLIPLVPEANIMFFGKGKENTTYQSEAYFYDTDVILAELLTLVEECVLYDKKNETVCKIRGFDLIITPLGEDDDLLQDKELEEKTMYRAVAFYQALQSKNYHVAEQLATDDLALKLANVEETGRQNAAFVVDTKAPLEISMPRVMKRATLTNKSPKETVHLNLEVSIKVDKSTWKVISFVLDNTGKLLVSDIDTLLASN